MQNQEGKSRSSISDDQYRQALRNFANIEPFEALQSEADEELQDEELLSGTEITNRFIQ